MKKYRYEKIELEGNVVYFDGYVSKDNKLYITAYYGTIVLQQQAIQDFCVVHGYAGCIIMH